MKKILLATVATLISVSAVDARFYVGVSVGGKGQKTKLSGGKAAGRNHFVGLGVGAAGASTADVVFGTTISNVATTDLARARNVGGVLNSGSTTDSAAALRNAHLDPNGNKWHGLSHFGAQAGWSYENEGGFYAALDLSVRFNDGKKKLIAENDAESMTVTSSGGADTAGNFASATGQAVAAAADTANSSTTNLLLKAAGTRQNAMMLSNKFNAGLGVKVGYKAGNTIPYVYVGGDYGQYKIHDNTLTTDKTTKTKNKVGFAAGVGVIGHINDNLSMELSYRYANHGSFDYDYEGVVNVATGTGIVAAGTAVIAAPAGTGFAYSGLNGLIAGAVGASNGVGGVNQTAATNPTVTEKIGKVKHKIHSHAVTIGINYHFG